MGGKHKIGHISLKVFIRAGAFKNTFSVLEINKSTFGNLSLIVSDSMKVLEHTCNVNLFRIKYF